MESRFWTIIESSRRGDDEDAQANALRTELAKLSLSEIEEFECVFRRKLAESYSWDLWGAAYVANGGASDDGFEYFRRWLIAQGQDMFESVLKEPDSLAGWLMADRQGPLEAEAIGYVAGDVWGEKSGRDPWEMPDCGVIYGEPSGTPFEEDPDYLSRRYPKLWQRFV